MVALRFATFWLIFIAPAMVADARADRAEYRVRVDDLELMIEPTDSAYSTGSLRRGDRVVVLAQQKGWATVQPPRETFHWINANQLRVASDGTCSVAARSAQVRYGADSAQFPGPPCETLTRGTVVRVLDRPDLKVGRGDGTQTWRAIEPGADEVRYVRLDAIERPGPVRTPVVAVPETTVAYQRPPPRLEADLPAEVNAELVSIAASERSIKAGPMESWNLGAVRERYESLLRQFGANPDVKAAITPRLDRNQRDAEISRKAKELARLLRAGDQRDAEVAQIQRSVEIAQTRTDRKYDAQGLLQASSRHYQGQKVLALIGPEGRPISYLTIPPGIPVNRFLARKVGVRGIVHFDEGLGARLISVRDLELIEKVR